MLKMCENCMDRKDTYANCLSCYKTVVQELVKELRKCCKMLNSEHGPCERHECYEGEGCGISKLFVLRGISHGDMKDIRWRYN